MMSTKDANVSVLRPLDYGNPDTLVPRFKKTRGDTRARAIEVVLKYEKQVGVPHRNGTRGSINLG